MQILIPAVLCNQLLVHNYKGYVKLVLIPDPAHNIVGIV
jgi:hypothetical protein